MCYYSPYFHRVTTFSGKSMNEKFTFTDASYCPLSKAQRNSAHVLGRCRGFRKIFFGVFRINGFRNNGDTR